MWRPMKRLFMHETGKYIYGFISSNTFFRLYIPKESNVSNGIYTISYQDISAVVKDSKVVDYTHVVKDTVARFLVEHQKVTERIMNSGFSIIPMRLGTFAQDETEVEEILNKGYSLIKEIMKRINDKIEVDVCATWSDFNSVLKEIGEEKEIKGYKEKLIDSSKGITVDDQMKLGIMVKKGLVEKREKYAQKIEEVLKMVSQDFKVHELMDDNMVFNGAFLIDKHDQKDFDRKLEELDIEFNPHTNWVAKSVSNPIGVGVNFRCICPLPPYSFYTLEIKKMQFKEIDWARKKLGLLNDFVTKDEIQKAYRISALSFHPDNNPNISGIEKEFDEVKKAHSILGEYSLSSEQSGQGDICSFNEREFKRNAILVKVRE